MNAPSANTVQVHRSGGRAFPSSEKYRVLIFIGSLRSGGKERRLVELLTFFKNNSQFEFLLVLTRNEIHYQGFYDLNIPVRILSKRWKKDPLVFWRFGKICREFRPHVIHTWGRMQTLYTLPAAITQQIPLINSQITGAPVVLPRLSFSRIIDRVNFCFSRLVLANSYAGLHAFAPPLDKQKVIYNGINLNRFRNLPDEQKVKEQYGIRTPFAVVMAASFMHTKNYDLFYRLAAFITAKRKDITFIGAGGVDKDDSEYRRLLQLSAGNPLILFPGKINEVEALVNACTIGVLFSTNGEGISNAILEYMALGKPVIANEAGGTKELVRHNVNGYLVADEPLAAIAAYVMELIDNPEKREAFGQAGKAIIHDCFSLEKMGNAFEQVYQSVIRKPAGAVP